MSIDMKELIDSDNGVIDRRIFWDSDIYQKELKQIFARCWQFVAHESQVKTFGDFLTTYIGEDAVIVARAKDNSINVMLNSCPHRGNKVCFAGEGKVRSFICNYHGWAFGLDGQLNGMPANELYDETAGFNKADWGLHKARVETYKGLVFATFDQTAPSLEAYLGDFRWYLDAILDIDDKGTEFIPGTTRSLLKCNWKYPADNFVGDIYHALWTHLSAAEATLKKSGGIQVFNENSYQASVNGHGWEFSLANNFGNAATMGDKEIVRYLRDREQAISERLGEVRGKLLGSVASGLVFPNLAFLPGYLTFRTFLPKGATETELHSWTLVPSEASDEIKDRWRLGSMRTFSPSGILEMDDGENWEHATIGNAGYVTRHQKLCYGMNPTKGEAIPLELPGHVTKGQLNDENQRQFFKRYAEFMMAESWQDIPMAESKF